MDSPLDKHRRLGVAHQDKTSLFDRFAKALAVPAFLLAVLSLGWQVYTYQESHEESPRIHGSVTQTGKQLNPDKDGKLSIQITNLGKRTMQIKTVTLSGWNRVWVLYVPPEKATFALPPGCDLWTQTLRDYAKYPIDVGQSPQPADFLVTVETTRAVHQQHVFINTFMLGGPVPTPQTC
jgi:hypothetical protein